MLVNWAQSFRLVTSAALRLMFHFDASHGGVVAGYADARAAALPGWAGGDPGGVPSPGPCGHASLGSAFPPRPPAPLAGAAWGGCAHASTVTSAPTSGGQVWQGWAPTAEASQVNPMRPP